MKFRFIYSSIIFGSWLCFGEVFGQEGKSPSLESLVPQIHQDDFRLESSGQHYTLTIGLPDTSTRIENVELRNPNTSEEELFVTGEVKIVYPDGFSVTTYEAGKNGYIAKYRYIKSIPESERGTPRLSIASLKSAAG